MNMYSDLYNMAGIVGKIFVCIAVFIKKFYGYNLICTNLIVFSTVFLIHSIDMKRFNNALDKCIDSVKDGFTIDSITNNFAEKKKQHSRSVNLLNDIFTSGIIFGVVGSFFTMKYYNTTFVDPFNYINIVIFLITLSIYIYVMHIVKITISDISSSIRSPKFRNKFLIRFDLGDLTINNPTINSDTILHNIEKNKNRNINISSLKMSMNRAFRKEINRDIEINETIKEAEIRSMIKDHEIGVGIDWIMLSLELNDDWEKFNLFGFEIEDSTFIKKFIAVIGGFSLLSQVHTIIGF